MEETEHTPEFAVGTRLIEIRKAVANRPETDKNAMQSACGEYNCQCHYDVPFLLRLLDKPPPPADWSHARINTLGVEILEINRANGWNVPEPDDWDQRLLRNPGDTHRKRYKIPTHLALIHSEVSEALEEFRKDHRLDHFGEELADVLIRVIELGAGLGIDLDAAVAAKLAKNRTRGHRSGGRLI